MPPPVLMMMSLTAFWLSCSLVDYSGKAHEKAESLACC